MKLWKYDLHFLFGIVNFIFHGKEVPKVVNSDSDSAKGKKNI